MEEGEKVGFIIFSISMSLLAFVIAALAYTEGSLAFFDSVLLAWLIPSIFGWMYAWEEEYQVTDTGMLLFLPITVIIVVCWLCWQVLMALHSVAFDVVYEDVEDQNRGENQ